MSRSPSPAIGEPVHNHDIFGQAGPVFAPIRTLIENTQIAETFACHQREADRLKVLYVRLGQFSTVCIGLSAIYAVFRAFWSVQAWLTPLDITAVILGALGITLDLYAHMKDFKLRWLINRFAAERVRSTKFQLYALAIHAQSANELHRLVAEETAYRLDHIADELRLPIGALNTFHGPSALYLSAPRRTQQNGRVNKLGSPELLKLAIEDYRNRRVRYQHAFAEQMSRDIIDRQRGYTSLSDALFVIGAVLLVGGLALRAWPQLSAAIDYLEATGLAAFILAATAAMLRIGSAHLASSSRYQQYSRDLARLGEADPISPAQFLELIERMELLALRELDDFWRDMWISSYRT